MSQVVTETDLRERACDRLNLAPNSRNFDCKFIEPGFVSYRDVGGKLELLRKETLDRCMDSVVGNALIIGHTNVTPENRADLECGIINEWYYNSGDGWYYVKGVAESEAAVRRIKDGWKPSCGYKVRELGAGGMDHGIRYTQEILDLTFNHLAIVERPRYAGSDFRLNSQTMPSTLAKLLKRVVTKITGADGQPAETVTTAATELPLDTLIRVNGIDVPIGDLFQTYLDQTRSALHANPEDSLEMSGQVVTMGQLAAAHKAKTDRENALRAPAPAVVAPVVAPVAAVTETPEQKATRENGQEQFRILNAARNAPAITGGYSTSSGSLKEKVELGKKKY